ncbi:AhpA/YtjB family protein [Shewanella maritima]|uniref:AhpA/YtjB family protein n=1 Tax=Shewanella maritima TaxID=2520507 RepID=UPI00373627FB
MIFVKGLKKRQKFSRIIQVILAIALIFGLINLWQTSLKNGQNLINSQTNIMARLLAQQAATGAAPAMYLQNDQQLQWLATKLAQDPKVISVHMYNSQGVRLAFAQSISNEDLGPDSQEMKQLLHSYPPLIENVIQNNNNLGYIEVRLNLNHFFEEIKALHEKSMELQQIMLCVAGFIGFILSRALSFKRADYDRRRTRAKLRKGPKITKKNNKQTAQAETSEPDRAI